MTDKIDAALLAKAFVGMDKGAAMARGTIVRLLDGDMDKAEALAREHGLQNFSDYAHKGRALTGESKALAAPSKLNEDATDSNPWVPDIKNAKGEPDWSPQARRAQAEKCRAMGVEFASRLAASAAKQSGLSIWLGAPRPGAPDLTPRHGNKDTRTQANFMEPTK